MYTNLLVLTVLILPLPLTIWGIKRKEEPYNVIFKTTVITMIALVIVFAIAMASGNSIGTSFENEGKAITDAISGNPQLMETFEKQGISSKDLTNSFKNFYDMVITILPATFIIWTGIISFIYCKIIVKIFNRKEEGRVVMAPFREFSFSREALRGIILIFFLSLITSFILKGIGESLYLNVSMLMEFAFSILGLAVILYFFNAKNLPGFLGVILCIILWFLPMGNFILLLLGVVELVFGIRKRIELKQPL